MADQKISALNAKTTIHDTDLFPMVDIEAETDETKKITGANLRNAIRKIIDADGDTGFEVEQSADEDAIRGKVAGVEVFLLSSAGILTLAKQSGSAAYRNTSDAEILTASNTIVPLNAELFDHLNEFTLVAQGTATAGTTGATLKDSTNPFVEGDVGKGVWNHTNGGYTTIAAYVSAGEVTLTADIDLDPDDVYEYGYPRFTATEAGTYVIAGQCTFGVSDGVRIISYIAKNGSYVSSAQTISGGAASNGALVASVLQLDANDYIELRTYHNEGSTVGLRNGAQWSYIQIGKIA